MPKKATQTNKISDEQREIAKLIRKDITNEFKQQYSEKRIAKKKNLILILIGVFCLLCIMLMFGTNYYIFKNMPTDVQIADTTYTATLLSDGLAIIAIAISVWAGLNIANAVERKELDDTNEKIKKANHKISKAEDKIKEEEALIKPLIESTQSIKNTLSFMFENELIKTIHDTATLYFYKMFSSLNTKEKIGYNKYYPDMIIIEQIFSRLCKTHTSEQNKNMDLENLAEKGILTIDLILQENRDFLPNLISIYLEYRKAEFFYYLGYITTDQQKYYDSFINAAELYIKLHTKFNAFIPNYTPQAKVPEFFWNNEHKEISMYFANSIGDAYSRFVLYADASANVITKDGSKLTLNNIIEIGKKGIFYCSCAAKWTSPSENHEVYYRNLGCAYERLEKIEDEFGKYAKEIIYNYSKAFESIINYNHHSYRIQSVYHTLIQYLKKYLESKLSLNEIFQDIKSFKKALKTVSPLSDDYVEYLKKLYYITNFAKLDNPRQKLQYSVNGLTLAIVVFYKLKHDKSIEKVCDLSVNNCIQIMKNDITHLEMMGIVNDNYFIALTNRYNTIINFIDK